MSIEEILALEDDSRIVYYLRQRKTKLPDAGALARDWFPELHDVMDKAKRPDGKVLKKEAYVDDDGVKHAAVYEDEPVNRIALPLEQDITNIHTAFAVGKEPTLKCTPSNDGEKGLLDTIKTIGRMAKLKYHNKRFVRSWLSEKEAAEYWYVAKDDSFWNKVFASIKRAFGGTVKPQYKLKCALWSPLRGDKLYPHFNDEGDYDALSREYIVKDEDGNSTTYLMCITSSEVITWDITGTPVRIPEKCFKHGFKKNPTIYAYRPATLCENIRPIRERLEKLMSNFADCIDMNFFPRLILEGELANQAPVDIGKSKLIKVENGGKVYYLNWAQTADAVKLELDNLWNQAYQLTNTPRLSLENLRGLGDIPSGRAFEFLFLGTNLATEVHYEVIGEAFQRRYNFLSSAVGSLYSQFEQAAETIDIDVEMNTFSIEDLAEKIQNAKDACGKPVVSQRTGIVMAGIVDDVDDEMRQIQEENRAEGSSVA